MVAAERVLPALGATRLTFDDAADLTSMLRLALEGACLVYLWPVLGMVIVVFVAKCRCK